jgi:uncharacterized protein (TIGR02300 family)
MQNAIFQTIEMQEGWPMATKADRGVKRLCQNCRNKFYDLGRSPIICPICQTEFELRAAAPKAAFAAPKPAPIIDDASLPLPADAPDLAPLEEADGVTADLEGLDGEDLADIEDAADIDATDEGETFLEDDEEGDDVAGFVGGPMPDEDEV